MAHRHDPVVRHSQHNLLPWIAFLGLACATAVALYLGAAAKKESGETSQALRTAGPPCVDTAKGRAVRPSRGCRRFFVAIANLCAQDPQFCRRSQRRAARQASATATDQQLAQAQLPDPGGGGGSGGGNNPNSQPSPPSVGGGGGNSGEPNNPTSPPTVEQPPVVPQPETPRDPPLINVPDVVCKTVDPVLGPPVQVCP